ncbi:MAG: adenosylcobinamide amidohydrolase [Desulfatirhabdiaceae bacterium]
MNYFLKSTGRWVLWGVLSLVMHMSADASAPPPAVSPPVTVNTVALNLDYVSGCRIVHYSFEGLIHKTLVIDFNRPMTVLSTLDGWRPGIQTAGNHYAPLEFWAVGHGDDLKQLQTWIPTTLGKQPDSASFLFTGADMDHLSVQTRHYRDMTIFALITAGVRDNAQRSGRDAGNYYEAGTINILLLTNRLLSPGAMARALITATEAKTAALQDLDVRSSYTPMINQATGTGTDNIIVVQGNGPLVDSSGGHTKMGELIARAVHAGVKEAIHRQNGIGIERNLLQRLEERKIDLAAMIESLARLHGRQAGELLSAFYLLMADCRYADFLIASFAISDAVESRQITDLSLYQGWCRTIAGTISGKHIGDMPTFACTKDIPPVIRMAIDALLCGICPESAFKLPTSDEGIAVNMEQRFWK